MDFKLSISFATDWLQTLVAIDSESCQTLFPSSWALPSEVSVLIDLNLRGRPFLCQVAFHLLPIGLQTFGCYWFRIIPVIFELLRAAMWSSWAVWFESEQMPFLRTCHWLRSAALHRIQFGTCCFGPMSYFYSQTNEWSKDWAKW